MKESNFSKIIVDTINSRKNHFAYKIPDAVKSPMTRFIPKKPFDIFVSRPGGSIAIECKQFKEWKPLTWSVLETSQIQGLTDFEKTGNPAFILLHLHFGVINRFYIFHWSAWKDQLRSRGVSVKELKDLPYLEIKKSTFDFEKFTKRIDKAALCLGLSYKWP